VVAGGGDGHRCHLLLHRWCRGGQAMSDAAHLVLAIALVIAAFVVLPRL
jgi:hypothetical protein